MVLGFPRLISRLNTCTRARAWHFRAVNGLPNWESRIIAGKDDPLYLGRFNQRNRDSNLSYDLVQNTV